MKKYLFCSIIWVIVYLQGISQSDYFQTVDHDSRHAHIVSMEVFGDGVIYSTVNDQFPTTRLNYINADNELVVLFESYFDHQFVKYYPQTDGTMHMYMCGLFDYDIAIGSVYKFIFDGEQVELIDIQVADYFDYISDVEVLDDGSMYILKDADILKVNADGMISDTLYDHQNGNYYARLFQNPFGDIFAWNENQVVQILGDDELLEVFAINDDENKLRDIIIGEDEQKLFVATKDYVSVTNYQFDESLQYEYPDQYYFKSGIAHHSQSVFFVQLYNDSDEPEIWHNGQTVESLIPAPIYNLETNHAIKLDFIEDKLILGGYFELVKPTAIIKSFPWFDSANYDYVDISLDYFDLDHVSKDTAYTYINGQGELVVEYSYNYSYSFEVTNKGTEVINHFDVYSSNFFGGFANKLFFFSNIEEDLSVGETKYYEGTYESFYPLSLEENAHSFYIPGANYLKDGNETDNVVSATIVSSTIDQKNPMFTCTLYPNPTHGILHLDIQGVSGVYCKIMDVQGQLLVDKYLDNQRSLDVHSLMEGVYFIHLQDNRGHIIHQQFVIK